MRFGFIAICSAVLAACDAAQPIKPVGRPEVGEAIIKNQDKASCLLCHQIPAADAPFQGTIGPVLQNLATRYSANALRQRLSDPKQFNPNTIMPSYRRSDGFKQIDPQYQDQSVYTAQEMEDVIAFLLLPKEEVLARDKP